MISTAIAFLVALLATAVLTPLVRKIALRVGAVDEPAARRVHTGRIPRLGGVAIVGGFFLALIAIFGLQTTLAKSLFQSPRTIAALAVGSLLVAALGLADDIAPLGAKRKLAIQAVAASIAYFGGLHIAVIQFPFGGSLTLGWLSYPLTVMWILAVINAINLIDGLDGLAAGIAFFACLTNFVVAALNGNTLIAMLSATIGGSIIGFLIYNFNPATIFMGDSGSMFLGFVLATTSLMGSASQKSPTVIAILVPLLALGLPIMDMLFTMVRRFLERRSIFSPDRGHIHHRLLDLGLTHRRAVLTLYAVSLSFTIVALLIHVGRSWQVGLALLTLTASTIAVVRIGGYLTTILAGRSSADADAFVLKLRKAVPGVLARLSAAPSVREAIDELSHLGTAAGLARIEIVPSEGSAIAPFVWDDVAATSAQPSRLRELEDAEFPLAVNGVTSGTLCFSWENARGGKNVRVEVLLQLVADATEEALGRRQRARAASRSGRLRPVS